MTTFCSGNDSVTSKWSKSWHFSPLRNSLWTLHHALSPGSGSWLSTLILRFKSCLDSLLVKSLKRYKTWCLWFLKAAYVPMLRFWRQPEGLILEYLVYTDTLMPGYPIMTGPFPSSFNGHSGLPKVYITQHGSPNEHGTTEIVPRSGQGPNGTLFFPRRPLLLGL